MCMYVSYKFQVSFIVVAYVITRKDISYLPLNESEKTLCIVRFKFFCGKNINREKVKKDESQNIEKWYPGRIFGNFFPFALVIFLILQVILVQC